MVYLDGTNISDGIFRTPDDWERPGIV
jgi:hypothetical protein